MMQNSLELMTIHFAASRLGAVILNLNTNLTADELVWQLDTASCCVMICDDIFRETVKNALVCDSARAMGRPIQVMLPLPSCPPILSASLPTCATEPKLWNVIMHKYKVQSS